MEDAPRHAVLAASARRSLDWISSNLERFAPVIEGRVSEYGLKAFTELALVYSYLHQWPHQALRPYMAAWSRFMVEWCTAPVLTQMPRKRRAVGFAYLLPYLMLRATGYRSDYHELTLVLLERSGDLRPPELVPYRVLEREHALWRSGFVRREPVWRRLAATTHLLKAGSYVGLDDEAAYAITHALFYLTDFGGRPAALSHRQRERAIDLVEVLLLHYWRTGHWDLVGELLTNLHCLDAWDSEIYSGASRAYEAAWGEDGTVPPRRPPCESVKRDVPGHEDRFRTCYHPTLVAVLYSATAMNAGRRRAAREDACTA